MTSASSTHSVDVFLDIERRVKLHDPVHLRNIETSGCHIGAQEDSFLNLPELVESCRSFLLLLLTVNVHDTDINIVE